MAYGLWSLDGSVSFVVGGLLLVVCDLWSVVCGLWLWVHGPWSVWSIWSGLWSMVGGLWCVNVWGRQFIYQRVENSRVLETPQSAVLLQMSGHVVLAMVLMGMLGPHMGLFMLLSGIFTLLVFGQ